MGADPLVRLDGELVRRHAGTVDQLSDGVALARSAVLEVTMDPEAYGYLCQFLPSLLESVFDLAADAMNGAVDALTETASHLRTATADIEATDVAAGDRIAADWPPNPGSGLVRR